MDERRARTGGPPGGGALRDRLRWDAARGAIADGPRRYLMVRPDVLMGARSAPISTSGRTIR